MIRLEHLRVEFESVCPLKDVSVEINPGDVISVIGPSGTGKSTLLRCINLLCRPTAGKIFLNWQDITAKDYDINILRRNVGMVFQSFNLFGHLTVIENIMMPQIDLLGRSRQDAYDRAVSLLEDVGLAGRELDYPDALSGGQKQRIAIVRALAMDPEILLFDEPTSALDPIMVGEVQDIISKLAKQGKTMMIVTHEMDFARNVSNRVFYMDEGGIYEDGTPEQIFENPQKIKTIEFIRQIKKFTFQIIPGEFDLYGINAQLSQYFQKNKVPQKSAYKIFSIIEEMGLQIFLPIFRKNSNLFSIEYDNKKETVRMVIKYSGPKFDPADSENKLAYSIVTGLCQNIVHTEIQDKEYTNQLIILI